MTDLDLSRLRALMPVAQRWAYFDHAAVAPLTAPARDLLVEWTNDSAASGDVHWPAWAARRERTRKTAAAMLNAEVDEIALVGNTTVGINLVAEGFPWRPGDNVVTLADEFPSNLYPWMNLAAQGVETRRVPSRPDRCPLADVEAACDARTRLITLSWVNYAHGWRHDLAALVELKRRRRVLLFVDAIQGLGVFPIDVAATEIDFLAADGHKWLLGPEGAGIFYLRREHLDLLRPLGVGWNSVEQAADFSHVELRLKHTAARSEGGTYNTGGMVALGASLELLASFGADALARRVLEISELAVDRLRSVGAEIVSARGPAQASGIVSFTLPGREPQAVRERCLQAGVALSCRAGRLRISPHAYNTADDIDRLIAAL